MYNKLLVPLLALGVFSILNTEMGIIGLLPMISDHYKVDIVTSGLLISFFALAVAISGPTLPLLCSKFNRKTMMLLVLSVFSICNVIAIFSPSFTILLLVRVLPAFLHPVYCALAFSLAAQSVAQPQLAPRAVAKINMGVAAGMVLGVPVSNYLANTINLEIAMAFFAVMTILVLILTLIYVPSLPVVKVLTYGAQLAVLKKLPIYLAIISIITINGSIYGIFNYFAEYLNKITQVDSSMSAIILFAFGGMNVVGSFWAGFLLVRKPVSTILSFPIFLSLLYVALTYSGQQTYLTLLLAIIWGVLGGINANINQYLMAQVTQEARDFGNGLFLTSANIGAVLGTSLGGLFITQLGLTSIFYAGIILCAVTLILVSLKHTRKI